MPTATSRRAFLTGAGSLALLPASVRAESHGPVQPPPQSLHYDLSWNGIPLGYHTIVLSRDGATGDFTVTNRVNLVVDLLLFDAMRFEHESTEVWRAGRLVQLSSTTLDNGDLFNVTGTTIEAGLLLEADERDTDNPDAPVKHSSALAPRDILTNNDIWIAPEPGTRPLLNAKNGEVVSLTVDRPVPALVEHQGKEQAGLRYKVESAVAIGDLIYLENLFVEGTFERRSRTVDYRLA
jgi:hypothetical protein